MASRGDPETGDSGIIRLPAGHRSGKASEDWEVVAKALDHRLDELGWTQTVLAQRSRVSSATIRELLHGAERRRNARILQDVSIALGWHPDHLGAILHDQPPPPPDLPGAGGKPVQEHLEAISNRLDQLAGPARGGEGRGGAGRRQSASSSHQGCGAAGETVAPARPGQQDRRPPLCRQAWLHHGAGRAGLEHAATHPQTPGRRRPPSADDPLPRICRPTLR
jgi:hypothetical protein